MDASTFRRMFNYNYHAHRLVWGCVLELNEEQYHRPCNYSVGSVHEQVVHTIGAEWLWLQRVRGEKPDPFLQAGDFPTRADVRARWDRVEAEWRAFVNGLRDEQLSLPLIYTSIHGNLRREQPLWEALAQIVNHGTDHRAQTLALIHQVGGRTLEQDFILYAWDNPTG